MKRTLSWGIAVGAVVAALVVLRGQGREASVAIAEPMKGPSAQPAAQTSPEAGKKEEKIAHTFEDEAKMRAFAKLWQQRQGVIVRMTVLKAYFSEEQAALDELNQKITSDYQLDATKNYLLDPKRRVLIERDMPVVAAPEASSNQPLAAPTP